MPRTKFAEEQRAKSMYERIMERVEWDGDCLIWPGATQRGYGAIRNYETEKPARTHRVVYEHEIGPIPEGMVIDHVRPLCNSRRCVNVKHLEVVSLGENTRRGADYNPAILARRATTHCPQGHEYTPENTYTPPKGGRFCRTCGRAKTRAWYHEKKKAANQQVMDKLNRQVEGQGESS